MYQFTWPSVSHEAIETQFRCRIFDIFRAPFEVALALAIRYSLTRWASLTRYVQDGRIEIDNNAAERALRGVALGRKNFLFVGSDAGGQRAAIIYTLVESAKLYGLDPEDYLRRVLTRVAERPINRIAELLPWNLVSSSTEQAQAA
jgi:transposase